MAEEDANWRIWLAAAQAGDRRAYGALLAAALPWLRARARGRWPTATLSDIEDIVQETLLALHRSLALYQPPRPVAPFLFGIMKLRGAEVRRQRHRHAARETILDDVPVTSQALRTNPDQDAAVDQAAMQAAIGRLSPRDQEILDMLKLRELSLLEAAAVSGLSVTALKVGTFRAIRRLRRAMGVEDVE
ncbi:MULTISPECIES: RNA polymerase sigma factor [Acidiphilium]|uniref:RNA polymerase sigma-70 factor, ECF subfamily n=1 Tax=Acidiphilium rubrum TaxID=526 RepID=A0A8G2CP25_ACIRU|nr:MULTISPECIES: sigma-70 family RNA polymerase sigma factor [Acidiphilium]SIR32158.1 RNA polymerase sigma-70 factor, ECF subfamily [Acidiphilium rubrum]